MNVAAYSMRQEFVSCSVSKINYNPLDGPTLSFVNCHCKSKLKWELVINICNGRLDISGAVCVQFTIAASCFTRGECNGKKNIVVPGINTILSTECSELVKLPSSLLGYFLAIK